MDEDTHSLCTIGGTKLGGFHLPHGWFYVKWKAQFYAMPSLYKFVYDFRGPNEISFPNTYHGGYGNPPFVGYYVLIHPSLTSKE